MVTHGLSNVQDKFNQLSDLHNSDCGETGIDHTCQSIVQDISIPYEKIIGHIQNVTMCDCIDTYHICYLYNL